MKILIDDKIPYIKGVLEKVVDVKYFPGAKFPLKEVADSDALIVRTRTKCSESLLKDSKVKAIATATIGYDHIDTEYCNANNIFWTNAPGCNSSSVQQYITAAILHLAEKYSLKLSKLTLGVVGVGNVGTKVVKAGRALGMNVLMNDPPRKDAAIKSEGKSSASATGFCGLRKILAESDIITLHVPHTKDGKYPTHYLANQYFIGNMKESAFLINSSRGPVADNAILKKSLQDNLIRGAILDVWENEPDIDLELLKTVELGTPHIAGYSADGKANGTAMSINAISKIFELGLDKWFPENVPQPIETIIKIDKGMTDFQIIKTAIDTTYNIQKDAKNIKESPENFEYLRGNYPLRREPTNYSIFLPKKNEGLVKTLEELGFTII
ncbi:MAG: 4-phosphoerythronate dehydrogenase [Verrucomicrobiota bacterium]|nr:4-phosphoerythronate dehydrogenase [Verrucomicrobiota bacterium]